MATLEEIANGVKSLLNRPDFYAANPEAGQVDIEVIYRAVNTVVRDIILEEDFRVCEAVFAPDSFTAEITLPNDFKKLISVWYVNSDGVEVPPQIMYLPFNQAIAYRYRGDGRTPAPDCPEPYVCTIFGNNLRIFPEPPESETGSVRMFYYRFLDNMEFEDENYFAEKFPGYLTEAAAVHILKSSVQPRGDNSVIYDFERLVNNLKNNILLDEVQSKGTSSL